MTDRLAQVQDLLISQYQQKANLLSFLGAHVAQLQDVEQALDDLLYKRGIDTAEGQNLDIIGKIVVLDRPFTDPDPEDVFTFGYMSEGTTVRRITADGNPRITAEGDERVIPSYRGGRRIDAEGRNRITADGNARVTPGASSEGVLNAPGKGFTNVQGTVIGGYLIGLKPIDDLLGCSYRHVIRAKVITNTTNGSLADMHRYADFVFGVQTNIIEDIGVVDVAIASTIGRQMRQIIEETFPPSSRE